MPTTLSNIVGTSVAADIGVASYGAPGHVPPPLDFQLFFVTGVGAQSTLGKDIFARKYMHEKLAKCLTFTCPKNVFRIFLFFFFWGGANPLTRCLLCL